MNKSENSIHIEVVKQTGLRPWQVSNTLNLLNEGATVPFIARYRKEATGNLDEQQIRNIQSVAEQYVELEKRRAYIIEQITAQEKMTPALLQSIQQATQMADLEDLYLPYKSKRKTKADVAKERGLEPLAKLIFEQKNNDFKSSLPQFLNDAVPTESDALQGARDIIAEWISENTLVRGKLRELFSAEAVLTSKSARGKKDDPEAQKFKDYFAFSERIQKLPPHRFLALRRGAELGFLSLSIEPDRDQSIQRIKRDILKGYSDATDQVKIAMEDAYDRLLAPSLENEMLQWCSEKADQEAIALFAVNVKQLLLAPPIGERRILAIDPGFRTGCKTVCLDEKGNLLAHGTIYPHEPQKQVLEAEQFLKNWVEKYQIEIIAIGNGTAGRETEAFAKKIFPKNPEIYMVNESGASIYSAGEVAREEFPQLDVTVRGAISIGRRLMDPLAELVKIDPESIGVGQYQHDVNKNQLKRRLDEVVESAVNTVGVNINTASKHLLSYVSGLGKVLAGNIVAWRSQHGAFTSREQLKEIPRLGGKAFEQCAGFLRIRHAKHPLDNSAVHPERYPLVEQMAQSLGVKVDALMGNQSLIEQIQPSAFLDEQKGIGLPTIEDILKELKKPGLDPRGAFESVGFSEEIKKPEDLEIGMELNGMVTNITDFGAFVDIGVKQDGLVHVSQLSQKFVKHPLEVVSLGQIVKVRVLEVDLSRKRISLTMKF